MKWQSPSRMPEILIFSSTKIQFSSHAEVLIIKNNIQYHPKSDSNFIIEEKIWSLEEIMYWKGYKIEIFLC